MITVGEATMVEILPSPTRLDDWSTHWYVLARESYSNRRSRNGCVEMLGGSLALYKHVNNDHVAKDDAMERSDSAVIRPSLPIIIYLIRQLL